MCKNCFDEKNRTMYHGTCKKCGSDVLRMENLWSGYVEYGCPVCKIRVESREFYTVFDDENSNPDFISKAIKPAGEPFSNSDSDTTIKALCERIDRLEMRLKDVETDLVG